MHHYMVFILVGSSIVRGQHIDYVKAYSHQIKIATDCMAYDLNPILRIGVNETMQNQRNATVS